MFLTLALLAARKAGDTSTLIRPQNACANGTLNFIPDSVRIVVGLTCVLSMIGAVLIVLSYVLIPTIRTKAREIIVNLSLMDFMVATANLIGIITNFSDDISTHHPDDPNITIEKNLCVAQASFAMYGTLSSVFWTICVAVYVFLRIMLENSNVARRSVYVFYVICYGLPLLMTLWFSCTGKLGFDHYGGSGWCSLKVYGRDGPIKFNPIFGNDIWIYLTMILVPLLFISLHFYIRYQVKVGKTVLTQNLSSAVQTVERKLILIPIIFILLRVWSLLLGLLAVELEVKLGCTAILFFLHMGGIGDSGQGFANAILFVVFTPKVRRYFLRLLLCPCVSHRRENWRLLSKRTQIQYGSLPSQVDTQDDYSATSQTDASGYNEKDTRSLLVNTA